jgi:hypothetical protein
MLSVSSPLPTPLGPESVLDHPCFVFQTLEDGDVLVLKNRFGPTNIVVDKDDLPRYMGQAKMVVEAVTLDDTGKWLPVVVRDDNAWATRRDIAPYLYERDNNGNIQPLQAAA